MFCSLLYFSRTRRNLLQVRHHGCAPDCFSFAGSGCTQGGTHNAAGSCPMMAVAALPARLGWPAAVPRGRCATWSTCTACSARGFAVVVDFLERSQPVLVSTCEVGPLLSLKRNQPVVEHTGGQMWALHLNGEACNSLHQFATPMLVERLGRLCERACHARSGVMHVPQHAQTPGDSPEHLRLPVLVSSGHPLRPRPGTNCRQQQSH